MTWKVLFLDFANVNDVEPNVLYGIVISSVGTVEAKNMRNPAMWIRKEYGKKRRKVVIEFGYY